MSPEISILCPTRGRPENVRRLVDSAYQNSLVFPEFIFYIDDDDNSYPGLDNCEPEVKVIRGPRVVLSEMWNLCYEHASADILMHCGDDIVFRTSDWDQRVVDVFDESEDKILLVHGDDGFNQAVATHSFLHRRWVETVGYFVPPYFSSDYNDLWLTEVADALGRRVKIDILTEHMHPCAGKAEWDLTHRERLERHKRDNVEQLYKDLRPQRAQDIAKLRAVMEEL